MTVSSDFARKFDFSTLALHWKLLVTGFVVVLGIGYLTAALNAALSVGLSADAIADHYGDKSLSREEHAMMEQQGFVEEEFSLDDLDEEESGGMAMDHDMTEMDHDMGGMDMGAGAMHEAMSADDSLPPQLLVQLAHIHLLGFSLILITIGALTCLTRMSGGVKSLLVTLLFLSFVGDMAGLNLTRFVSDSFAWVTMVSGTLIGIILAIMILRILWELWGPRPRTV